MVGAHSSIGLSAQFDNIQDAIAWARSFAPEYETEIRDENNIIMFVQGAGKTE